jgi:hypothetical protein
MLNFVFKQIVVSFIAVQFFEAPTCTATIPSHSPQDLPNCIPSTTSSR